MAGQDLFWMVVASTAATSVLFALLLWVMRRRIRRWLVRDIEARRSHFMRELDALRTEFVRSLDGRQMASSATSSTATIAQPAVQAVVLPSAPAPAAAVAKASGPVVDVPVADREARPPSDSPSAQAQRDGIEQAYVALEELQAAVLPLCNAALAATSSKSTPHDADGKANVERAYAQFTESYNKATPFVEARDHQVILAFVESVVVPRFRALNGEPALQEDEQIAEQQFVFTQANALQRLLSEKLELLAAVA